VNEYKATVTFDQPQMGFIPIKADNEEMAWAKAKDIVKGFKNPEVLDINLEGAIPVVDNVIELPKKEPIE